MSALGFEMADTLLMTMNTASERVSACAMTMTVSKMTEITYERNQPRKIQ